MHYRALLLSFSLLAGCSSLSAAPAGLAPVTEAPHGLGSAGGPQFQGGNYRPAPEIISRFLLSLPADKILVSPASRLRYLQGDVLVKQVQGEAGNRNYVVADRNESSYGFWIRSFQGDRPELNGYLVQVQGLCAELQTMVTVPSAAQRQCRYSNKYFSSGMRAYRVTEGHPPEDVTASIAPDPAVTRARRGRYADIGASEIFADDMNLDQVPVFRWTIETDPDQPISVSDPHTFYNGHRVHAGFVVWNGERFEKRKTVPRALWPCEKWRDDDGNVLPCPDATPEGDRFVTGDK